METRQTDRDGSCVFKNVPVGQYTIEVVGNHLIYEQSKKVEVKVEPGKSTINYFVGVRAREDFQAKFDFLENVQGQMEQVEAAVDAKAVLLPAEGQDLEEFDFDILFDRNLGVWTATLVSGSYLITVKSPAHKEFN